jgi:hypothetical protein
MSLVAFWPYIVAYSVIGLLFMCIVNYIKGKKRDLSVTEEVEYEVVASLGAAWPVMILMLVFVYLTMIVGKPLVALASYCERLGRRHRG